MKKYGIGFAIVVLLGLCVFLVFHKPGSGKATSSGDATQAAGAGGNRTGGFDPAMREKMTQFRDAHKNTFTLMQW